MDFPLDLRMCSLLLFTYLCITAALLSCVEPSDAVAVIERRMVQTTGHVPALVLKREHVSRLVRASNSSRPVATPTPKTKCHEGDDRNCSRKTYNVTGSPKDGPGSAINETFESLKKYLEDPKLLCLTYSHGMQTRPYDPKTQICCNGLFNKTSSRDVCCYDHVIDTGTHVCCGKQSFSRTSGLGCCVDTVYQRNDTLCCNESMLPKTKYSACCGNRVISEIYEVCCGGRTFPKKVDDDNITCCGTSLCNSTLPPMTTQKQIRTTKDLQVSGGKNKAEVIKWSLVYCGVGLFVVTVVGCVLVFTYKTKLCTRYKRIHTNSDKQSLLESSDPDKYSTQDDKPQSTSFPKVNKDVHTDSKSVGKSSLSCSIELEAEDGTETFMPILNSKDISYIASTYVSILKPKPVDMYSVNRLEDHFRTIGCQTISSETSTAIHRRTVFGTPFLHRQIVDIDNPIFEMPNSDVTVRLPQSALKECPIEMHGTSYDNIPAILQKFSISEKHQELASPTTEFMVTGTKFDKDHAVVKIPFLGDQSAIHVWKFHSDDGIRKHVEPFEIPPKHRENIYQPVYYEVQGDHVLIFTDCFSGFFITTGKHSRPKNLELTAYIFGSHKRIAPSTKLQVWLRMFIADEIMKFKDYSKRLFETEMSGGRQLKFEKALNLTPKVQEDDYLEAYVTVTTEDRENWVHMTRPATGEPIYQPIQTIKFGDIATKCENCTNCHFRQRDIPLAVDWGLENSSNTRSETFSCVVDVNCVTRADTKRNVQAGNEPNILTVDELKLRPEDRLPIAESNDIQRLENLQRFLVRMPDDDQELFITIIQEKYDCTEIGIPRIFANLLDKMKPRGVYEAVVATLRRRPQLQKQLISLQNSGILQDEYFPRPVQRAGEDRQEVERAVYAPSPTRAEADFQRSSSPRLPDARMDTPNSATDCLGVNNALSAVPKPGYRGDDCCRNELGSDLPVCSYSEWFLREEAGACGGLDRNDDRRDTNKTGLDNENVACDIELKDLLPSLPVQEHASLDETEVKNTVSEDPDVE